MRRSDLTCRWLGLFLAFLLGLPAELTQSSRGGDEGLIRPAEPPQQEVSEALVETLIQQLGAENFARREKAEAELSRWGLAAFDALHRAQSSDDIEIAFRARRLLRSMAIRWFRDDDPASVKELLRGYDERSADERRSVIEELAKLRDGRGLAALCRLARFDPSTVLSKRAALLALQTPGLTDPTVARHAADTIRQELGFSRREPADWLRTFATGLAESAPAVEPWQRIREREEELLRTAPEQTAAELVRDLLRWEAGLWERLHRPAEAEAAIAQTLNLLDGSREQLAEMANWLVTRQAWRTLEQLAERFPQRFGDNALLLYALAEAQLQQGRQEQAEQTAGRALQIKPDTAQDHIEAALQLQERGLFGWSEREYRQILDRGPVGGRDDVRARLLLSEMLHDQLREADAAGVLRPLAESLDRDQNAIHLLARIGREPGTVRSRMHYFHAEHERSKGDVAKQIEHLREAIKHDPTDADVLIAMYRVAAPNEAWPRETLRLIRQAVQASREQTQVAEQQAAEAALDETRLAHRQLATALNQLAWLVSNTEGDYDEALRCSLRSLELAPDTGGYLDTLGRCYFAKKDLVNAVKAQTRAAELDPHSSQIRRQLEFFKAALQAAAESR